MQASNACIHIKALHCFCKWLQRKYKALHPNAFLQGLFLESKVIAGANMYQKPRQCDLIKIDEGVLLRCKNLQRKQALCFCVQKLRANLWFASLTKQSFVWRQNYSPKAAKLRFASLTKQSFVWRQNYVLQAIQSLQSEALYKLCKALASHTKLTKLCVQKLCFCKYKLCKALWIASLL